MRNSPRKFFHRPQRKFYFINGRIEAPTLRVIDNEGKQIGVLSRFDALKISMEKELDLVLIAPHASPPVTKIIDFKKFLYQEQKKEKEAKKGIKKSITKDLTMSLFIGQADLDRLIKRGIKFLTEGNQLRLNLTLRGREIGKKQMAFDLIKKIITQLGEVNVSKEPRVEGRVIRAVVAKKK